MEKSSPFGQNSPFCCSLSEVSRAPQAGKYPQVDLISIPQVKNHTSRHEQDAFKGSGELISLMMWNKNYTKNSIDEINM